jgi:hypothetical protein
LRELILLSPHTVSYFNDLPARDLQAVGSTTASTEGDVVDKMFVALGLADCVTSDQAYSHCEANR